jgi:hypothetical protein
MRVKLLTIVLFRYNIAQGYWATAPLFRNEPELEVPTINGKLPEKYLAMHDLANKLGNEGWELIRFEHTIRERNQIVNL